jgi:uncharacterized tellurite resistance protein B-like protein
MKLSKFLGLFKEGKVGVKSHMKNLIEVAMVDGHFDESEKTLLDSIAKKYGVSASELKSIHDDPSAIQFEVPKNEDHKFEQLFDLVNMMVADELTDREEIRLCGVFARKFGYKEAKSDELVDAVANNIMNGQSMKDTKVRIQWLLN